MCFLEKLPKEIFTSHNFGDASCKSISKKDRNNIAVGQCSNIQESNDYQDEEELAEMFGYGGIEGPDSSSEEVKIQYQPYSSSHYCRQIKCKNNFISPVASQILTVFENADNTSPVHIDLDSGATLNYCQESEVLKRGYKMFPNKQLSKLGDGFTNIQAVGEIHVKFFRNNTEIKFNAVVCKHLNSPFIGGTLFIKENGIEQDFGRNVIHLHGRQVTIQSTDPISVLPSQPIVFNIQVALNNKSKCLSFKNRSLLPGQEQVLNVDMEDGCTVAVEPHEKNKTQAHTFRLY